MVAISRVNILRVLLSSLLLSIILMATLSEMQRRLLFINASFLFDCFIICIANHRVSADGRPASLGKSFHCLCHSKTDNSPPACPTTAETVLMVILIASVEYICICEYLIDI